MTAENISVLDWPGNSPDLDPIENLWALIKRRAMAADFSTIPKLITTVIQSWFHDEELGNMCQKLVDSMPKQVSEVIKTKGGHIRY